MPLKTIKSTQKLLSKGFLDCMDKITGILKIIWGSKNKHIPKIIHIMFFRFFIEYTIKTIDKIQVKKNIPKLIIA